MWDDLIRALCLMLVIEGILPFVYPARWRRLIALVAEMSDRQLRLVGLASMLIGALLLMTISK